MENIIEINNLRKSFGEIKAVDNISFSVKRGSLFAFLGLNGAGKSTTINIICGDYKKDGGQVIVDGIDIDANLDKIKTKLGVVYQDSILDKQLLDFKNAGVNEVFLLAGFLSEKIEERYGLEYNRMNMHYIIEDEPLGTLNAIRLGMEAIDDENCQFVIRNGDIVSDFNLKKMIEYGEKSSLPVTMFVTQLHSPYGIVDINGDKITSFKEKPILEDYYINGGIYFVKGKFDFGEFKTGDIEKTLFPKLAKENKGSTAFWRFADFSVYYPERLATDKLLHERFISLGGKPREKHPLSFVLQGYSDNLDEFMEEIREKYE